MNPVKKKSFLMYGSLIAVSGIVMAGAVSAALAQSPDVPVPLSVEPQPMLDAPMPPAEMGMPSVNDIPAPLVAPEAPSAPAPHAKAPAKKPSAKSAKPAKVEPLPAGYLVVRKEADADALAARLAAARTALSNNQNGAALDLFNGLYEQYPNDKRVLIGRAVAMQRVGRNAEALAAYEEVLRADPRNIEALTNMLGIISLQERGTAIEKLRQLSEVYPFNADVAAQLGMLYGQNGDYANAVKHLEVADNLRPGNLDILYNRAVAYDRMGDTDQAAMLYRKILMVTADGTVVPTFSLETIRQRLATMR